MPFMKNNEGFDFTFDIKKAEVSESNGKMIIRGVASTMSVDRQDEAMSKQAMDSMLKQINSGKIPLHKEHGRNFDDRIGHVIKGEIDNAGNLIIEAELNKKHPIAQFLYDSIKSGETLGLSVAGKVKGFTQQMRTDLGKVVRTLGDVVLREISVTKHPANLDTIGLTAKSNGFIYDMAKSVPESAWLASEKGHYMDEEKDVVETAETGEPTTEAAPAVEEQVQEDTVAAVTADEGTEVAATTEETESAEKGMSKMPVAKRREMLAKFDDITSQYKKALMDVMGHADPEGAGLTEQDAMADSQKSELELDESTVSRAMTKAVSSILSEELAKRDEAMADRLTSITKTLDSLIKMPLQRKGVAIASDNGTDVTIETQAKVVTKSEVQEVKTTATLADALQNAPYMPVSPR